MSQLHYTCGHARELLMANRALGRLLHLVQGVRLSFPVNLLVMAAILSSKLPTTFGRAILVALCDMLVALLAVGVLVGIAVFLFGVAWSGV
jgi:hypothetical protein